MVRAGQLAGVRTEALLTRMDAPLGRAVGNAIEVIESIETLRGQGPRDLTELSVILAARMVLMAGRADTIEAAPSGRCARRWRRVPGSTGSGGWSSGRAETPAVVDDPSRLPLAPGREFARAPRAGYVTGLDALLHRARRGGAGRRAGHG